MREHKLDVMKGILVIGMIYCHVLQFFGEQTLSASGQWLIHYINVVSFSGFVFVFGYTSMLAYYTKPYKSIVKKVIWATGKMLVAFYTSGVGYRILAERRMLQWEVVKPILLMEDMPGWSEFLASFALLTVLPILLYPCIKKLGKRGLLCVAGVLLLTTFFPYGVIEDKRLGLIFGTYTFAVFPVLQYGFYYFMGIWFQQFDKTGIRWQWSIATIASGIGVFYVISHEWQMPQRFPPSIYWIVMGALPVLFYYRISARISRTKVIHSVGLKWLRDIGANSLFFLLLSNLLIFACAGLGIISPITTLSGVVATGILMACIVYMMKLIRPISQKPHRT